MKELGCVGSAGRAVCRHSRGRRSFVFLPRYTPTVLLPFPHTPNFLQLVTVMREQYKVEDSEFFAFWRLLCKLLRILGCFLGTVDAHTAREALALWAATEIKKKKKKRKLTKHCELRMQSVENTRELRLMCVLSVIFKRSRLLRCLSDDPVAPLGCPECDASCARADRACGLPSARVLEQLPRQLMRDLTCLPRGELSVSLRGFSRCAMEPCRVLPHFCCHHSLGPPRQAAPGTLALPPATSIEHDVRTFSTLAQRSLRCCPCFTEALSSRTTAVSLKVLPHFLTACTFWQALLCVTDILYFGYLLFDPPLNESAHYSIFCLCNLPLPHLYLAIPCYSIFVFMRNCYCDRQLPHYFCTCGL